MALFRSKGAEPKNVSVLQLGRSFPTQGKESILNDALEAGIPFPHSCTVGTCGTCKVRLVEGKVRELSDSANVLSSQELRDRYVLACQSLARTPVVLDVAGLQDMPDHALTSIDGEIAFQRLLTHDIMELGVKLVGPLEYTAGQYAELAVPDVEGPRAYSFSTGVRGRDKDELTFFCRLVPGGAFTEWLFAGDRMGTRISVKGPFGNLWLRPGSGPIVCVAGGSGLAPVKALIEDALDAEVERDAVVIFGARTGRDLYCLEELDALATAWPSSMRVIPVLSEEMDDRVAHQRGLVTDAIAELSPDVLRSSTVYVCGPPPMVDAVEQQVGALGHDPGRFHADRFLDKSSRA